MSFQIFIEDMMGFERYLEFIKDNWVDRSPIFGMALMVFAVWSLTTHQSD